MEHTRNPNKMDRMVAAGKRRREVEMEGFMN